MRGVLTLAGEGTRMLPWTRGLRKEFLPLFDWAPGGTVPVLKPVAHLVLETMVGAGADDVTLVVPARNVEFVRTYFSVDRSFLRRHAHHAERLAETERFYDTLRGLRLHYAVQPKPRGFGDAVLRAAAQLGKEPFVLHAADAVLIEPERGQLIRRLAQLRSTEDLDAVVLVRRVANPSRYGVVEGAHAGQFHGLPRLRVTGMEEKPTHPKSKWAATAAYAFGPRFMAALRAVRAESHPRELEVTAAIRWLLKHGGRVEALVLTPRNGEWRSVGSPEGYLAALLRTRSKAAAARKRGP